MGDPITFENLRDEERDSTRSLDEVSASKKRSSIPSIIRRKSASQLDAAYNNGFSMLSDFFDLRGSKRDSKLPNPPPFSSETICHICLSVLGGLKFKHNCRNCGKSVCGNHSTNNIPLPQYGIKKEVRVCDVCTKDIVQRRPKALFKKKGEVSTDEHSFGLIMNCMVEEQDNTMDSVLYFGTLRMGSKSLASRSLNANMAIWKERMFMLTHSEMLCFKPHEDSDLGEAKKSVHLSDILHIEIDQQFPRVITTILVDGRIFRLRAKTEEECQTIFTAVEKVRHIFLNAMFLLQRGHRDEDNAVLIVTRKDTKPISEVVVKRHPRNDEMFLISIRRGSSVCLYIRSPTIWGMAELTFDEICQKAITGEEFRVAAVPPNTDEQSKSILYAHLRIVPAKNKDNEYISLGIAVVLLAIGFRFMDKYMTCGLFLWSCGFLCIGAVCWPLLVTFGSKSHCFSATILKCVMEERVPTADEEFDIKDEDIDERFMQGCQGNVVEAKRRYKLTLQWRKNNGIDTLLSRPQPHFQTMKKVYPHYIHKRDKLGHPITIEFSGHLKKSMQDFTALGVSQEDAIMHQVFVREYLWKIVDPRPYPDGMTLNIMDIQGIGFADVGGEVISFMKKSGQAIGDNNPERMWKVFILNPPSWFNVIWKLVVPMINPKTRDKTHVVRGQKEISKALLEFVDADSLPQEYGGTCSCPGGCSFNSPEEVALRELVETLNSN